MKLCISIDENSYGSGGGTIIIQADDEIVYTSEVLDKVSTKKIEIEDLNINNCSVLKISSNCSYGFYPIIYDAVVYN